MKHRNAPPTLPAWHFRGPNATCRAIAPKGAPVTRTPLRAAGREELVGIVGWPQETNELIVDSWRDIGVPAGTLLPADARLLLGRHDVAIGRFDVRASLDGVQPGIEVLTELERDGVRVINGADALLNAHDKLRTTRLLVEAGIPHPKTVHVRSPGEATEIGPPVVVKPRYGSWGTDVYRCETRLDVARTLEEISSRPWFTKHGALIQELVPPVGRDLRLVVAAGQVVGAIERVARPGEWRTNVALGGTRRPTRPSYEACALGVKAASRVGADLVGVDLLPVTGGYVVLELNGAVEFDSTYDLGGSSVFAAAATALMLPRLPHRRVRRHPLQRRLFADDYNCAYLSAHRSARPPMAWLHGRARLCTDNESHSDSPFDSRHAQAGGRDRRSAPPHHRRARTARW